VQDLLYQADWLEAQLELEAARDLLTQALEQTPAAWQLLARRAEVFKNAGDTGQAERDLRQALKLAQAQPPDALSLARLHSRLLLILWSRAESWAVLAAELQAFGRLHTQQQPVSAAQTRARKPGPLRIGYLSPDFRLCSAGLLLEAYFLHHPRADLELFAYDLVNSQDLAQAQFQKLIPHWRQLAGLGVEQICEQIQADHLDVLVDLAGHTSLSGLAILARQPAPVQVTGLTFNGPVGLAQVPYRFTDPVCTPQGHLGEIPLYLPGWIFLPYALELPGKDPADLPLQALHLGCAHHPGRLSPQTLVLWAEILQQLPQSTLHLKHRYYRNAWCRQHLLQALAELGIAPERLHFHAESGYADYLGFYRHLDLVLDPFPYHGGLVSCDALWMGVPLVSLATWSRGGASLLQAVNFPAGIAQSPAAYVAQAVEIAQNLALRREAARHLRPALKQSWIGQPQTFVTACVQYLRQLGQSR